MKYFEIICAENSIRNSLYVIGENIVASKLFLMRTKNVFLEYIFFYAYLFSIQLSICDRLKLIKLKTNSTENAL